MKVSEVKKGVRVKVVHASSTVRGEVGVIQHVYRNVYGTMIKGIEVKLDSGIIKRFMPNSLVKFDGKSPNPIKALPKPYAGLLLESLVHIADTVRTKGDIVRVYKVSPNGSIFYNNLTRQCSGATNNETYNLDNFRVVSESDVIAKGIRL